MINIYLIQIPKSLSLPNMVWVFPLPVIPKAKNVALIPVSTLSKLGYTIVLNVHSLSYLSSIIPLNA